MTYDVAKILSDKAKQRKDGIYTYKTFLYAVKDNRFVAYCNYFGECFQWFGSFSVGIGKMEDRFIAKDKLKEWLKSQK